jgi:hypothetical protein
VTIRSWWLAQLGFQMVISELEVEQGCLRRAMRHRQDGA